MLPIEHSATAPNYLPTATAWSDAKPRLRALPVSPGQGEDLAACVLVVDHHLDLRPMRRGPANAGRQDDDPGSPQPGWRWRRSCPTTPMRCSAGRRTSGLGWRSRLGVAVKVGLQILGTVLRSSRSVMPRPCQLDRGEAGPVAGPGRGLHPPDDEPHRRGIGLASEGSVSGLGHIGGALHPIGDTPASRGYHPLYGLDEIAQAGTLATMLMEKRTFVLRAGPGHTTP